MDKNGYVELSLIGFVKVAGLTTTEARELIKQNLAKSVQKVVAAANDQLGLISKVLAGC